MASKASGLTSTAQSALGHKRRLKDADAKSGVPSVPDHPQATKLVSFGPETDLSDKSQGKTPSIIPIARS